jgi:hypothetical protein
MLKLLKFEREYELLLLSPKLARAEEKNREISVILHLFQILLQL